MPKPGGGHSSGTSLGDALRLPKRHPAWRRREAQPGCRMERENLAGDAKGKGASGSNREAESTDAPERGGLPRSSLSSALPTHSEEARWLAGQRGSYPRSQLPSVLAITEQMNAGSAFARSLPWKALRRCTTPRVPLVFRSPSRLL